MAGLNDLRKYSEDDAKKIGVLLVSHGSRLPYGKQVINALADMYRQSVSSKVGVGYMEMCEPTIPQAINSLVEGTEIETLIVVPVFLADGVHTTRDIPKILGLLEESEEEGSSSHKHSHNHSHGHSHGHEDEEIKFNGEIIYTGPLGADPLVLEIINQRVNGSLS
ncbi:MAG: sirohydrochlorin nickelochelatase [Methanobacteriaceae archaeon]